MLDTIKKLIEQSAPAYSVTYEEKSLFNVKSDSFPYWATSEQDEQKKKGKYAYIEEFRSGKYHPLKAFPSKTTRVQIYFFEFCQMENDATHRESIRTNIEKEAVWPFIEAYKNSGLTPVDNWGWDYPPTMFDGNDVGVILIFDFVTTFCKPPTVDVRITENEKIHTDPCKKC